MISWSALNSNRNQLAGAAIWSWHWQVKLVKRVEQQALGALKPGPVIDILVERKIGNDKRMPATGTEVRRIRRATNQLQPIRS